MPEEPVLGAIAARAGAVSGDVGPVEILRGALLATKASGQPDWPTRVSAARALAVLRHEEVEPKRSSTRRDGRVLAVRMLRRPAFPEHRERALKSRTPSTR
jgi:hypothetical protein